MLRKNKGRYFEVGHKIFFNIILESHLIVLHMIKLNPVIFVNFPSYIFVRIYSVTKQFKVIESVKVVISSKDTYGKPYNSGKKIEV